MHTPADANNFTIEEADNVVVITTRDPRDDPTLIVVSRALIPGV